jgi:hypothetical protein
MLALHPPPSWNVLPEVPEHAPKGLPISRSISKKAAAATANGSAPDLTGWTGELMQVLMRDRDCHETIVELCCMIRDGTLPVRARDCVLTSWLIALPKPGSGHRPIAGAPVLAKLAVNMCMLAHDKAIAQVFQEHGLQFGIGRPDG